MSIVMTEGPPQETLYLNIKHLEDCFIGKYEQTITSSNTSEGYSLEIFADGKFKYSYLHGMERIIYEGKWVLEKNGIEPGEKTPLSEVYANCKVLLTADAKETHEKREVVDEVGLGNPKKFVYLNPFGFCTIEDDVFGTQVALHGRASWVAKYVDLIQEANSVNPHLLHAEILQLLQGVQATFQASSKVQNIIARHGTKMTQGHYIDALNILLVLGGVWVTSCHPNSGMNDAFHNYGEFMIQLKQGIKDTLEKIPQGPEAREIRKQTRHYLNLWLSVYQDQVDESSEECKKLNESLNRLLEDENPEAPTMPPANPPGVHKRSLDNVDSDSPSKRLKTEQEKDDISVPPLVSRFTLPHEGEENESDNENEEQPKLTQEEVAKLQYLVQQQKAELETKIRHLQHQIESGEYPFLIKLPPRV